MSERITMGQLLDLIDNSRESEEMVCLMRDGQVQAKAMVCSEIWLALEERPVNSIQAEDNMLKVWLD